MSAGAGVICRFDSDVPMTPPPGWLLMLAASWALSRAAESSSSVWPLPVAWVSRAWTPQRALTSYLGARSPRMRASTKVE